MSVFLMHVGRLGSIDLEFTVSRTRSIQELVSRLPDNAPEKSFFAGNQLRGMFPNGLFNCWGVPEKAESAFSKTKVNDLVVFAPESGTDGGVDYFGFVKAVCPLRCYAASRILWPQTPADRLFPFLFFFDTEQGHVPWFDFLEELQYSSNWNPRGWYRQIKSEKFAAWSDEKHYAQHLRDNYGFTPISSLQLTINRQPSRAQCFTEPALQLDLMLIPGGTFIIGSPSKEVGHLNREKPQHEVTISTFLMGRYPVTQAQWYAIATRIDLKVKQDLEPDPSGFKGDDHPVENVSWHDVVEFCDRLSRLTHHTYRLPTEAEWEYACRAGTTTSFHFGETITTHLANYRGEDHKSQPKEYPGHYDKGSKGEYRKSTTPVTYFHPLANGFGLCDMHGNVLEWCLDHWHDNYKKAPADGSAWLTKDDEVNRVLRGGSWDLYPRQCRSAYRDFNKPGNRYFYIGFRVVCEI